MNGTWEVDAGAAGEPPDRERRAGALGERVLQSRIVERQTRARNRVSRRASRSPCPCEPPDRSCTAGSRSPRFASNVTRNLDPQSAVKSVASDLERYLLIRVCLNVERDPGAGPPE